MPGCDYNSNEQYMAKDGNKENRSGNRDDYA